MLHLLLAAAIGWQLPVGDTNHVESSEPFESLALTWSAPSDVAMRVRASSDGEHWSAWIPLIIDRDSSDPSEARYVSAIAHIGAVSRLLEISSSEPVARLRATFFPPQQAHRTIAPQSLGVGHLVGRSREDWHCPEGESSQWTPVYTTVTHAVVHHTAGANSVPDWEAEVRSIWYLHTFTNAWATSATTTSSIRTA